MMRFFLICAIFLLGTACREKNTELVANDTSAYEIDSEKWPKRMAINAKAQAILKDWAEFNAFETSFDALYTVANRDDLNLTIEDLIEKQKLLADSTYPKDFDKPQVKSRQKLFKTYMLKVKGDLIYRTDHEESVLQMIEAYNAFRNQFNIIVNSTLDTDLILGE